jgi:hypothetical protein
MATSRMGIKSKPLSLSVKLNIINKVESVANVPSTILTEEFSISVRKVTDKCLDEQIQLRMRSDC